MEGNENSVYPSIYGLPEDEILPFSKWLWGKTVPDFNRYYPWDYDMFKRTSIYRKIYVERLKREENEQ